MKTIKDLMLNFPSSCGKYEGLQTVASRMSISKIEFLPVLDENSEVIGTITYKDIQELLKNNQTEQKLVVADAMRNEACMIHLCEDEATALKAMRRTHSSYLSVVDNDNHLKGVVSFMTLARRVVQLRKELREEKELLKSGLGLSA